MPGLPVDLGAGAAAAAALAAAARSMSSRVIAPPGPVPRTVAGSTPSSGRELPRQRRDPEPPGDGRTAGATTGLRALQRRRRGNGGCARRG